MKNLILIFVLTVFLVSCGITDFDMPSWDVELTSIPLMNEDFPASDLEGENITIEGDSLFAVVEDQLEEATPELSKKIVDTTNNVNLLSGEEVPINFEIYSINSNTSFRIIEGTFESGEMLLTFIGNVNDFTELQLTFNQLILNGSILVLNLQPEDFTDNEYIIDLEGVTLTDQDIDGDFWLINIDVLATSQLPLGENVGQARLSVDDTIFFSNFIGFIDEIRTLDSEADVDIDYPNNIENSVILEEIAMYFTIYNQIGFEFELMGNLVAYRDGVIIDSLKIEDLDDVDFTIQASVVEGEETVTNIRVIDNERINQMLRLMPDNIALLKPTYKVYNLDSDIPGFVAANEHKIWSDYIIKIPLKATINDDFLIYPDKIHEVEINQDNQDLIDEKVNQATITLELVNNYPIGGILDLFISSTELDADSVAVEQAELKFLNKNVEVSNEMQTYVLELSKEDLTLFLRNKVFLRTRVRFHNSDGVVVILVDDTLNVKGSLNISLKIEAS